MVALTEDEATAVLREHMGGCLRATAVTRAGAGNSQETWLVEAISPDGPQRLVLRRAAAAGTLEWTDRDAEYRILRALAGRGLPVPEVYGQGVLERPYLLMERRPGSVPGCLTGAPRSVLAQDLGRWLARLHALDLADLGLERRPPGAVTLEEVTAWWERYRGSRPAPIPLLGALLAWAGQNVPDDGVPPALLWGDPGPHNTLVDSDRVSALLDWELAHVGHPLEDLGAAVWSCLGRLDAEEVVAAYEREAGPVERRTLNYFVVLACITRSVMVLNGTKAWLDGRTTAPAVAAFALDLVSFNLARGARAAGWGELPATDGQPPELPLHPDPAESAEGVARWLRAEVLPAMQDDPHLRRMTKVAAALLETAARRVPASAVRDPEEAEDEAVRAERAGGDPTLRGALLADLARELARLEALTSLHGYA